MRKSKRPTLIVAELNDHSSKNWNISGKLLKVPQDPQIDDDKSVSDESDKIKTSKMNNQKFNVLEWYMKKAKEHAYFRCAKKSWMQYTFSSFFPNIAKQFHPKRNRAFSPEIQSQSRLTYAGSNLLMEKGLKRKYLNKRMVSSQASFLVLSNKSSSNL